MSENAPEKLKKGCGCLQWGVSMTVLVLLAGYFMPRYGLISARAYQTQASSNARQIIGLLLTYASDYEGHYPDHGRDLTSLTSNQVFRELVKEGLTQEERIFSSPLSPFVPDNDIGMEPGFEKAASPGENHWMMVAGLGNTSPSHYPLVLENAADASWPPKWQLFPSPTWWGKITRSKKWPRKERGRSCEGDAIIIGHNDASVETVKLDPKAGFLHLRPSYLNPKDKEPLPALKILDIEVAR